VTGVQTCALPIYETLPVSIPSLKDGDASTEFTTE
jgi:hypothetical protein